MELYIYEYTVREYIWKELVSKRPGILKHNYSEYMYEQYKLGTDILRNEIPQLFGTYHSELLEQCLTTLSIKHSRWYKGLPYIAAFGFTQGRLISELRNFNEVLRNRVGLASSLFNICITLFDFIVDEFPDGKAIFNIITADLLKKIIYLDPPWSLLKEISKRESKLSDMQYLMLLMAGGFSVCCRHLCQYDKSQDGWKQLSSSIFDLYDAERKSAYKTDIGIVMPIKDYLTAMKFKSVAPTIAIYYISKVAFPVTSKTERGIRDSLCYYLGKVFWIIDDLADIIKDMKSGTISYVSLSAINILYRQKNIFEVESFLEALNPSIDELLATLQILKINLRSMLIPNKTICDLFEFAEMYISGWLNYGHGQASRRV